MFKRYLHDCGAIWYSVTQTRNTNMVKHSELFVLQDFSTSVEEINASQVNRTVIFRESYNDDVGTTSA